MARLPACRKPTLSPRPRAERKQMSDMNTGAKAHQPAHGTTRRRLLQGASALAGFTAGSGALSGFPTLWAQNIKDVVLRQAGSPVAAIPKIADQANKDLGFTISMQATENTDLLNRFLSQSSAIDIGDVIIVFMKYLVGRNVLQAIPLSKYKYWDQTIPLFTKGTYPDGAEASTQGVAPYTVLYATGPDGQKLANRADRVADRHSDDHQCRHARHPPGSDRAPDHQLGRPDQPRVQGEGSLELSPTTGVIDVAMAVEARGAVKYRDKGNMTRDEIDKTINQMIDIQQSGHFRSFWTT